MKKRCLTPQKLKHPTRQPGTERSDNTNTMKYLAIIALAAMALGLGACAKKEPAYTTTQTHSAYTGYSK